MGDGWISQLLVGFVRQYPKIRIEMVVANRRVNLIEEAIDLALRAGKLTDSTLVARKVADTELGLFASPSYLALRGKPTRLSELPGLRDGDCSPRHLPPVSNCARIAIIDGEQEHERGDGDGPPQCASPFVRRTSGRRRTRLNRAGPLALRLCPAPVRSAGH